MSEIKSIVDTELKTELPVNLFKKALEEKKTISIDIKSNIKDFCTHIHELAVFYYEEKNVETIISGIYVIQTIHFPKVTITNNQHQKLDLFDIYIRLTFNHKAFKLDTVKAAKTTYTYEQYGAQYNHSHISHTSSIGNFTDRVCFGGTTDIEMFRNKLRVEFNSVEYDLFLNMLTSWITFESIEGGPYNYIKSVNTSTSSVLSLDSLLKAPSRSSAQLINEIIYNFVNNPTAFKYQKYFEEYLLDLDIDILEKFLLQEYPKQISTINYNTSTLEYLSDTTVYSESQINTFKKTFASNSSSFEFKGEKIIPKLISNPHIQEKQIVKKIHPKELNLIYNKLKIIIKNLDETTRIEFS